MPLLLLVLLWAIWIALIHPAVESKWCQVRLSRPWFNPDAALYFSWKKKQLKVILNHSGQRQELWCTDEFTKDHRKSGQGWKGSMAATPTFNLKLSCWSQIHTVRIRLHTEKPGKVLEPASVAVLVTAGVSGTTFCYGGPQRQNNTAGKKKSQRNDQKT